MNRNIKPAMLAQNHRFAAPSMKRKTGRDSRHDAHRRLRTGEWVDEDQYAGAAPSAAFAADLLGETMPQNPGFGVRLEVLL